VACFLRSSRFSVTSGRRWAGGLVATAVLLLIAGAPYGILQHTSRLGAALQFVPGNLIFSSAVLYSVTRAGSRVLRPLRSSLLRVCANLSYCMYLIHCILMNGYDAVLKMARLPAANSGLGALVIRAVIILALCFLLGTISRKAIELPALRFKRYFNPPGPQGIARTAAPA
jgi:peptidoglycan/LPS O-acetylase OafA/YrhL